MPRTRSASAKRNHIDMPKEFGNPKWIVASQDFRAHKPLDPMPAIVTEEFFDLHDAEARKHELAATGIVVCVSSSPLAKAKKNKLPRTLFTKKAKGGSTANGSYASNFPPAPQTSKIKEQNS